MSPRRTTEASTEGVLDRTSPTERDAVSLTAVAVSSLGHPATDRNRGGRTAEMAHDRDRLGNEPGTPEVKPTRERILDVALDLFTENGYEQTSLREIASYLGVTKAALYYHFASKEEILLALHLRLHAVASGLDDLITEPMTKDAWHTMLDAFIDRVPENRQLIAMHARNRATFERIHFPDHAENHEDLGERLTRALNEGTLPPRDRIRMGLALATVMGGLVFGGAAFEDIDSDELTAQLKSAIDDLLG